MCFATLRGPRTDFVRSPSPRYLPVRKPEASAEVAFRAVARLTQSLQTALADPGIAEKLAELGTAPSPAADATPEALKAKLDAEIARWKPVIEAAGVYAD